jgi:hypothetical protein
MEDPMDYEFTSESDDLSNVLVSLPTELVRNVLDHIVDDPEDKCIVIFRESGEYVAGRPTMFLWHDRPNPDRITCHECYVDDLLNDVVAESTYLEYPPSDFVRDGGSTADYAALARVCSTIHPEALDYLYGGLPLHFMSLEDLERFIRHLIPGCLDRIRSIRVSVALWPEIPQNHILLGADGSPDIFVAMSYLRTILDQAPNITKVHILTHVPRLWDDDEHDGQDKFELAEDHAVAVQDLVDNLREYGREITMSHSIAVPDGLDDAYEIVSF